MPRSPADYIIGAGQGLGELSDAIYNIQDRKQKDLEKRDDYAKSQSRSPIADIALRVINGEASLDDAVLEHQVRQHIESQPSLTRQPSAGPWSAGYDNGPDAGAMIPYSEPTRGGRVPSGPQLDTSTLNVANQRPDISRADEDSFVKMASLASTERNRNAMMDYRYDNLGLGYDKLAAQQKKDDLMQAYRQASADYLRAKMLNMPEQMELARRRVQDLEVGLGLRGQELSLGQQRQNFAENKEYLKNTNETAWTIPAIDNILMKARTTPGMVPPPEDYTKRRTAEMLGKLPLVGGMASAIMTRSADQDLTQQQRDFRRQVQLAITPFRKLIVGSQITEGEMGIINELAGGQLSIEDTIAGLAALRQMMMVKQGRTTEAFKGAASRIGNPSMGQTLPPLSSGQDNDPYGLGALSNTPENDYFKQFGYESGVP